MSMRNWAENEIKIACSKENPSWSPNYGESFDYGCACYQSALKAYKSLLEDEHSGFSIMLTKNILDRLVENKPLTPITEEDFFSVEYGTDEYPAQPQEFLEDAGLKDSRQCPRMYSLFRDEDLSGVVTYHDVSRVICINASNKKDTFRYSRATSIIDEMFPITMPYYPRLKDYEVYLDQYKSKNCTEDFDLEVFRYIITPENEKIELNRYFYEVPDGEPITQMVCKQIYNSDLEKFEEAAEEEHTYQPMKWEEISYEDFCKLKIISEAN